MTTTTSHPPTLAGALFADGPASDQAVAIALYGWLVGRWEFQGAWQDADGSTRRARGEIHAAWVLEGRAIQDVWILPARDQERSVPPASGDFYGTTLRIYDPRIDAWHIIWSDPLNQLYRRQIGRANGAGIVQEGTDESGAAVRWSFSSITRDAFVWRAEHSSDGGATWQLVREFFARRVSA